MGFGFRAGMGYVGSYWVRVIRENLMEKSTKVKWKVI